MERLLDATARAERNHFWFRGFRRFVRPWLARAGRAGPPLEILDCGCGTGHNLAWLRAFGRSTGIDLTWAGLQYARAGGERKIAQASAAALPFGDARFDLVVSFDVIYALPDAVERAALGEMGRVLKPGGRLLLNVAALNMLRGNHSVLAGEVRRYTRPDLRRRLERTGLVVERASYTNASILPLVAGVRFAQRITGHVESPREISLPPWPVNAALAGLLAAEAALVRHVDLPIGSSLLVMARKPAA
ncbi:MAG TPA: class I SAM-dependent methyltransferase [Vicinamibacterales bacterium]|nr:class I SAM-dependent methyltransferase [Vicinamibacterales bacterium]